MIYSPEFLHAIDRLLDAEGGYANNPDDPGGETKFGISKRNYPNLDILNLTREAAIEIYWTDFWLAGGMPEYEPAVGYQMLDIAVNSGIETAKRLLQRAAGVADDGHVGPVTRAAVKAKGVNDMLMLIIAERMEFQAKLSTFNSFGRGWTRRNAQNLRYAAQDN